MKIPYVDLVAQHAAIKDELLDAVKQVLEHGAYIMGPELDAFEKAFAEYCGVKRAVGVGNGTDALQLAMIALGIGPGDEVITAPNSFLASVSSIVQVKATPVLVDVGDDMNINVDNIKAAITDKTKAVMPVHLTGRPAEMDAITSLCEEHGLFIIEDAAQAVGATYKGQKAGAMGHAGCFSLHPLKTLNTLGDGGIVTTNDEILADRIARLRNHGLVGRGNSAEWGFNSRLDTMHAAMLLVKLKHLDENVAARRRIAAQYTSGLADVVATPTELEHEMAAYHTYIIKAEKRDELQQYLADKSIGSAIHYPIPIHLQPAAENLGYRAGDFPVTEQQAQSILSLPVHPGLEGWMVDAVIEAVRSFYGVA